MVIQKNNGQAEAVGFIGYGNAHNQGNQVDPVSHKGELRSLKEFYPHPVTLKIAQPLLHGVILVIEHMGKEEIALIGRIVNKNLFAVRQVNEVSGKKRPGEEMGVQIRYHPLHLIIETAVQGLFAQGQGYKIIIDIEFWKRGPPRLPGFCPE